MPPAAQNIREQIPALAAVLASQKIICAHDRHGSRINALLEMREIHLLQGLFIRMNIYRKSDVFNAVAGKVLRAGDNAVILHSARQRGAHFSEQKRILAVCFLRSAPAGIAQKINAYAGKIVGVSGYSLFCYSGADLVFKLVVERSSPCHGDGETGAVAHNNAAGPVRKSYRRNSKALDSARKAGTIIVLFALGYQIVAVSLSKLPARKHFQLFS